MSNSRERTGEDLATPGRQMILVDSGHIHSHVQDFGQDSSMLRSTYCRMPPLR